MIFESLAPNTKITARNRDRTEFFRLGIAGEAGGASSFLRNPNQKNEINLGKYDIVTKLIPDLIYVSCGGAGGWGDPFKRRTKRRSQGREMRVGHNTTCAKSVI